MDFNDFIPASAVRIRLSENLQQELMGRVKELCIVRGTYVLQPGELCKHLYFVKNGFFRIFKSDGFEEQTIDFAGAGQIATALRNFLTQSAQEEGMVCEEQATVYRLSYHDWHALQDLAPEFLSINIQLLQQMLLQLHHEKDIYRTSNSAEKYNYLCKHYKGIANMVSQKHIASYLGITGPTLSTLLKDMLRRP